MYSQTDITPMGIISWFRLIFYCGTPIIFCSTKYLMSRGLKARQLPSRESIHQVEPLTLSFLCMHHLDMMLDTNFFVDWGKGYMTSRHWQESYAAALEPLNDMNGRLSLMISLRILITEKMKIPSVLNFC